MSIEITQVFAVSPAELWAVVGDPGRVDWVPGVASAEFDGQVRRFVMQGAGQLAERIVVCDAQQRLLQYSVIESTPPLQSHLASMQVAEHADGCELVWRTEVEPAAVEPFIQQGMQASIAQLQQLLG